MISLRRGYLSKNLREVRDRAICVFRNHLSRQRVPNVEVTVLCSVSHFYISQNRWLWELLLEQKYLMSIFARKLCRKEMYTRKGLTDPLTGKSDHGTHKED